MCIGLRRKLRSGRAIALPTFYFTYSLLRIELSYPRGLGRYAVRLARGATGRAVVAIDPYHLSDSGAPFEQVSWLAMCRGLLLPWCRHWRVVHFAW